MANTTNIGSQCAPSHLIYSANHRPLVNFIHGYTAPKHAHTKSIRVEAKSTAPVQGVWKSFVTWLTAPSPEHVQAEKILDREEKLKWQQIETFQQDFEHALEDAMNCWIPKKITHLAQITKTFLTRPNLLDSERQAAQAWIDDLLEINLKPDELGVFQEAFQATKKRITLQQPRFQTTVSGKNPLFPGGNSGPVRLCINGDQGVAVSDKGSGPRVMPFTQTSTGVALDESTSNYLAAQIENPVVYSAAGSTNIHTVSCLNGVYHFLSTLFNGAQVGTGHFVVVNGSLTVVPYIASIQGPAAAIPTYPWKPGAFGTNEVIFAPYNATGGYLFASNPGGIFPSDPSGKGIGPQLSPPPLSQEVVMLADGSYRVLIQQNATSPVLEFCFGTNGTLTSTHEIYAEPIPGTAAPNTPIEGSVTTVASTGPSHNTPTLYAYDLTSHQVIYKRTISTETGPISDIPISQCSDGLEVYARESYDLSGNKIIKFDYVDAGDSVIGGEQTFSEYSSPSGSPQPYAACFPNGTAMIAYVDETQTSAYFTVSLTPLAQPPASPSPQPIPQATTPPQVQTPSEIASSPALLPVPSQTTPSPVTTPSASLPTPITSTPVLINFTINIPPDLSQIPIPLNISITPNAATIRLVDPKNYNITFSTTGFSVPICGNMTRQEALTILQIALGTAKPGDIPVFEGCQEDGTCNLSNATSIYAELFDIEGVPTWVIAVSIAGAIVLVVGGVVVFVFLVHKKIKDKHALQDTPEKLAARRERAARLKAHEQRSRGDFSIPLREKPKF